MKTRRSKTRDAIIRVTATAIRGSGLHIDKLLAHIEKGEFKADDVITHRLKLDEAPHGYEIFSKKKDNCVKVVMTP